MENKITFLVLHLGYGGIPSATINTANALCADYPIEIISVYNLSQNQSKLLDPKITVKYLIDGEPYKQAFISNFKKGRLFKTFKEGLKSCKILYLKRTLLVKCLKSLNSRVVVSTQWDISYLLSKYKKLGSIAIAQEHHHYLPYRWKNKYIKTLSKKYQNIDYLLALTNDLAKDYRQFLKNNKYTKILVVPNMLNITKVNKSKLTGQNIISVGRLHVNKRVNELIAICNKSQNVNNFYIIGDGDEYQNLKQQITDLKLASKVELQKEIAEYMGKSCVFVMASITEGLPMVLLEAMAHGLPCIAYDIPGVSDIIEDGQNGYIIKNRDEQAFINKLDSLLANPSMLQSFSKAAIQRANQFKPKQIVALWQEILNKYLPK